MAIWFEIFALIDCFCLVSRKFEWHKKKSCLYVVSILMTIIFLVYYIPILFEFKIERNLNGGYQVVDSNLSKSNFLRYHKVIHTISRDFSPICISVVMNTLILFYIRRTTTNRQKIAFRNSRTLNNQARLMIERSINAEKNKIKMIIFTSCMHVFHLPMIFFNFNFFNIRLNPLFIQLCFLSINIYFVIPIVSYVAFNKKFRKYISNLLLLNRS
jgi:hypothetical protein